LEKPRKRTGSNPDKHLPLVALSFIYNLIIFNMKDTILQKLHELEQSENIRILYACESGSRAWGFASPDSDFDVRFVYAKSVNHYLSIAETKDVAGLPVNEILDIGGWDIKKALTLFLKSNAPLYEWLQ